MGNRIRELQVVVFGLLFPLGCRPPSNLEPVKEPTSTRTPAPTSMPEHSQDSKVVSSAEREAPPAVELVRILCNYNCRILEKDAMSERLFLVKTEPFTPNADDEWPEQPSHWFVEFDADENPVKFQKLFHGYLAESSPRDEGIRSTFQLVALPTAGQFRLSGHEPSPSGTAWGRSGELTFSWPDLSFNEWTYSWFHAINDSLSGSISWNWETASGKREFPTASFNFVIPELALDDQFRSDGWKHADFSRCSARLTQDVGYSPRGRSKTPPSARVVFSKHAELFVELVPAPPSTAETLDLKVCFSGEIDRSTPPTPGTRPPPCVDALGKLSSQGPGQTVKVERAGNRLKFVFPEFASDFTLIIGDRSSSTVLQSSSFDFKHEHLLGPTIPFEEKSARCELSNGVMTPHFGSFNPEWALMDQAPWL